MPRYFAVILGLLLTVVPLDTSRADPIPTEFGVTYSDGYDTPDPSTFALGNFSSSQQYVSLPPSPDAEVREYFRPKFSASDAVLPHNPASDLDYKKTVDTTFDLKIGAFQAVPNRFTDFNTLPGELTGPVVELTGKLNGFYAQYSFDPDRIMGNVSGTASTATLINAGAGDTVSPVLMNLLQHPERVHVQLSVSDMDEDNVYLGIGIDPPLPNAPAAVPEPSGFLIFGAAVLGAWTRSRRRPGSAWPA